MTSGENIVSRARARTACALLFASLLEACGGAATGAAAAAEPRGPEEVTAEWTSGDDAPLGEPASPASASSPSAPASSP